MKQQKIACFGYTIYKYSINANERIPFASYKGKQFNFLTKGNLHIFNIDGKIKEANTGTFISSTEYLDDDYWFKSKEPFEFFHCNESDNRNFLPNVEHYHFNPKTTIYGQENQKIFLCEGKVKVEDNELEGPYQLYVVNPKEIKCLTECLILEIK